MPAQRKFFFIKTSIILVEGGAIWKFHGQRQIVSLFTYLILDYTPMVERLGNELRRDKLDWNRSRGLPHTNRDGNASLERLLPWYLRGKL